MEPETYVKILVSGMSVVTVYKNSLLSELNTSVGY